jgi:hypothetical protein
MAKEIRGEGLKIVCFITFRFIFSAVTGTDKLIP